jgi:hypothetical protein
MIKHTNTLKASALFGMLIPLPLSAAQWTDTIEIRGFASAVYQTTNEQVFFNGDCKRVFQLDEMVPDQCSTIDTLGATNGATPKNGGINKDGSFRRTRVGLNINSSVNKFVTLFTQFTVTEENNYNMQMDWGFVSLAADDNNRIRAGKIKMPVGLVNEFQDVGFEFPWIEAPQLFYSVDFGSGNAARESFQGLSYLWEGYSGDWTLTSDLFYGDVDLDGMDLSGMLGYTAKIDWDESIHAQASVFSGKMKYAPRMNQMLNENHQVKTLGIAGDLSDFLFYAEYANVSMGAQMPKSNVWYASLGYRFGEITAMLTHQNLETGKGMPLPMQDQQSIDTVTLRYDVTRNAALKLELSQITTDVGVGLFAASGNGDIQPAGSVSMAGVALDVIF